MSSTNKLYSRLRTYIAKFLLSFCGIASFGVVGMANLFSSLRSSSSSLRSSSSSRSFSLRICSVLSLLLFSCFCIGTNGAYATGSSSNTVGANISSSIAIRLLDSAASTDITRLDFSFTPTASGSSETKRTIVDVATSNPTGYKLYMQSNYQDSNSNYTTDLVHTTNSVPDADIADVIPTYVPGSGSGGSGSSTLYWNYTNPMTSSATVIPAHGTPDKLDQYFDATNSRQTPVDINVSVDTTIVSGSYQNQLLFSTVANPTELDYTVSFNTNGGSMSGADIEETAAAWTKTITVPGAPSETDYTNYIPNKASTLFTGWTISIPSGSTATAVCSTPPSSTTSSTCKPGDNLTITAGTTQAGEIVGDVVLTAQYESISTMQAMTPTICGAAAIGASTTLTDTRDTNTYTIRKLKDGNCWMTQNLNFLPTAGTTLSLASSNVALTTTLQTTDSSKGNYLTDNCSSGNVDKYCTYYDSTYPEYGTYYNWYASTAGTGTSDLVSVNATSSVCPKGWRLPTGGEGGEFQTLYGFYNSWELMTNTNGPYFILGGRRDGTSSTAQGKIGRYWSSLAHTDATRSHSITLDGWDNTIYSAGNLNKYYGLTLRCLAHDDSYSILGVDPNGGTWNGSTSGQTFTQAPESTQSISNPSTNASYTISYDMGSTGITPPTSPTSASRSFTGWALSGAGSFAGATYEYGTGNGLLTAQYNSTSDSFNLPTLSKSGYNCAWHQGSASGTVAQNNVTITGNTTFYAVCAVAEHTIANSTYLQEVTSCPSTLTTGTQYSLKDQGETSKSYNTSKLADGKCWMTTNYNHTAGDLTSAYYNVSSSGYTIPTSNCTKFGGYCDGASQTSTSAYGGYYSWAVATAGSSSTTYSICPKGWRLPTQAEFNTLINIYSAASAGSKLTQSPVNMKYGGYCGGLYSFACGFSAGSHGYYWSSTDVTPSSYFLDFTSSSASVNATIFKTDGYSVRCVFGS